MFKLMFGTAGLVTAKRILAKAFLINQDSKQTERRYRHKHIQGVCI